MVVYKPPFFLSRHKAGKKKKRLGGWILITPAKAGACYKTKTPERLPILYALKIAEWLRSFGVRDAYAIYAPQAGSVHIPSDHYWHSPADHSTRAMFVNDWWNIRISCSDMVLYQVHKACVAQPPEIPEMRMYTLIILAAVRTVEWVGQQSLMVVARLFSISA